jgi:predicted PurR-regulated permease PerM
MGSFSLSKTIQVLLFSILLVVALYYGKPFLVPLVFAGILSMLFLTLCRWLENKGVSRGIAALCCILIILVILGAISGLIGWQISSLAEDAPQMEQRITKMIDQFKQTLSSTFGISPEKQQQMLKEQQQKGGGGMGQALMTFASSLTGILVDTLLTLVYIFLLLNFRTHIKKFILQLVPEGNKQKTGKAIAQTSKVAQQYLGGLGMMIVLLWVMYGIAFTIIGVKNAIFFAILCGLLEIIPFIGNLLGNALTVLMAITQGGGSNMIIAILITYAVVQFIQSYVLEPLVVGAEVNINPLFTILAIVAGELIWGIAGMILAIPILGITKIICDNVDALKPYGFLIGKEKQEKKNNFKEKIKGWFK